MPAARTRVPKVGLVTLGCPKALVDSERILTRLRAEGYAVGGEAEGADLVLVNTCGFLDTARAESLEAIGEALAENGRVIVTGCLGAEADLIRAEHPDVLAITGPHQYETVMEAVHAHLPRQHDAKIDLVPPQGLRLTPRHYAYLKISEGCDNRCTFCIIPQLRGDLASRPVHAVLKEAEQLLNAGVKELLVISQDTSAYGRDVKYAEHSWRGAAVKTKFLDLTQALGDLAAEHGAWVRLHYVYPYPHVDAVIPLMSEGKILPYLDIPFQHAAPNVLRAMKRPAHAEKILERIKAWRAQCPDLTVRSSFIVGFPGETEENFETLLDFVEEAGIDRAGCFKYENVEGAPSRELSDHIDEDEIEDRYERFMNLQTRLADAHAQTLIDKTLDVIVDGYDEEEEAFAARSKADAPEIDGLVLIEGGELKEGQFARARIAAAAGHVLRGALVR